MATAASVLFRYLSHRYDRMALELRRDGLDETHEVQVIALNHAFAEVVLTSLSFAEPDLLVLESENPDGTGELLVLSPSAVNITYRIVTTEPGRPPSKVGFNTAE